MGSAVRLLCSCEVDAQLCWPGLSVLRARWGQQGTLAKRERWRREKRAGRTQRVWTTLRAVPVGEGWGWDSRQVNGKYAGGCNDGPEPWMGVKKLIESGQLKKVLSQ